MSIEELLLDIEHQTNALVRIRTTYPPDHPKWEEYSQRINELNEEFSRLWETHNE